MIPIYVINFNDDERKKRMIDRFNMIGEYLHFVQPVTQEDPRLEQILHKRTCSIMLQHLDSIRHFYENTSASHCMVCEDDIHISKYLADDLPDILKKFDELELDLLLMGYLWPYSIEYNWHFPVYKDQVSERKYNFCGYPDDLWGSQMYVVSRKYAKYLLDNFDIQVCIDNGPNYPYNPDWIITKNGKRAVISPMIAVEEGDNKSDHHGQNEFHRQCFSHNYRADIHI